MNEREKGWIDQTGGQILPNEIGPQIHRAGLFEGQRVFHRLEEHRLDERRFARRLIGVLNRKIFFQKFQTFVQILFFEKFHSKVTKASSR